MAPNDADAAAADHDVALADQTSRSRVLATLDLLLHPLDDATVDDSRSFAKGGGAPESPGRDDGRASSPGSAALTAPLTVGSSSANLSDLMSELEGGNGDLPSERSSPGGSAFTIDSDDDEEEERGGEGGGGPPGSDRFFETLPEFRGSGRFAVPKAPKACGLRRSTGQMAGPSNEGPFVETEEAAGEDFSPPRTPRTKGEVYDLRHSTGGMMHEPMTFGAGDGGANLPRTLSDISSGSESTSGDDVLSEKSRASHPRKGRRGNAHQGNRAVGAFLSDPTNDNWDDLVKSMTTAPDDSRCVRSATAPEATGPRGVAKWGPFGSRCGSRTSHRRPGASHNTSRLDRSAVVDEAISRNLRSLVAEDEPNDELPCIDVYHDSPRGADGPPPPPRRARSNARRASSLLRGIRSSLTGSFTGKSGAEVESLPANLRTLVAGDDDDEERGGLGGEDGDDDDGAGCRSWARGVRTSRPLLVGMVAGILAAGAIAAVVERSSNKTGVKQAGGSVVAGAVPDWTDLEGDAASARLSFCDECRWQDTEMTCLERVAWEMEEYQVSEEQAREANLIHCAVHWSDAFCGECPYRDTGMTCEARVIWEMEHNELCRVDAEAAVLADCMGPAPSEDVEDEEELDLAGFCSKCPYQDTGLTCEEKVQWEMEYNGLCKTDAQAAILADCTAQGADAGEVEAPVVPGAVPDQTDLDGDAASARLSFCDECKWQNTEMTCVERVAWEMEEYHVSEERAREANLIHCAVHWSDAFCGECPYRDTGMTCEARVIWEMEHNELCRVDAEAAVLADCTGPAPSEGPEDEEESDLAGFCSKCPYKDTDLTCEEKVQWEMEYNGLCKTDAQSAILPDCTAQGADAGEDEPQEAPPIEDASTQEATQAKDSVDDKEPEDLLGFCDGCPWKDSEMTCLERVAWEVDKYQVTEAKAKWANLIHCTDHWSLDFCGECPYQDTGVTCEERAVWEMERNNLCRVDAEAAVLADCVGTPPDLDAEEDSDIADFCGECPWKDTGLTCEERVQWELEYEGLCRVDAESAVLPHCKAFEPQAASPEEQTSNEQNEGTPDVDKFCNDCQWKSSPFTCGVRVAWEMERYGLSESAAQEANQEYCTKSGEEPGHL